MLRNLIAAVHRHPRTTLGGLLVLCVLLVPAILRLEIRSEIVQLLPPSLRQAQAFKEQMAHYTSGRAGYFVHVTAPNRQQVTAAALSFAEAVRTGLPHSIVVTGMDTAFVNTYALWMANPDVLAEVAAHLDGAAPNQLLAAVNTMLETVDPASFTGTGSGPSPESRIRGLIDFLMLIEKPAGAIPGKVPAAVTALLAGPPLRIAPDGKSGFFMVLHDQSAPDSPEPITYARQLKAFTDRFDTGAARIAVTGNMMLVAEESAFLVGKLKYGVLGTALAMFLFLLAVYRSPRILTVLFVSLMLSLVISTGIISLITGGHIHIVTAAFILLLLGMGIDFAIHITERCMANGDIPRTVAGTLKSLTIAAGSTIIIFLCLNVTGMPSLQQLGWVVALGIAVSLAVAVISVPALLALLPAAAPPAAPPVPQKTVRSAWIFITLITAAAAGGGWLYVTGITMEKDVRALRPGKIPATQTLDTIIETFNFFPDELRLEVTDPESLRSTVTRLQADPMVRSVSSALNLLPAPERIPAIRRTLESMGRTTATFRTDTEALKKEMGRLALNLGDWAQMAFAAGKFTMRDYLNTEIGRGGRLTELAARTSSGALDANCTIFETAAAPRLQALFRQLTDAPPYTLKDMPMLMRDRYLPVSPGRTGSLAYIRLNRDIWNPEVYDRWNTFMRPKFPDMTGSAVLSHKIVELIMDRGRWGLAAGCIICLLLLLAYFRSVPRAVLGFLPILAALLCTGYGFKLGMVLHKPLLNYISVTSLILIAGIGIDYTVHAIAASAANARQVRKSIMVSGVTSLLGFAGLWFTGHAGLQGLGLSLVIGLAVCMACAAAIVARKR